MLRRSDFGLTGADSVDSEIRMLPCCSLGQAEYGMLTRTVAAHASYSDMCGRASNVDLVEKLSENLLVDEGKMIGSDA